MRRMVLSLALVALTLSACELRAEIDVNEDGSGTFGMVFGVEPEMAQFLNQPGFGGSGDPFADLRKDLADDPVAWQVSEYEEGGLSGIRATFPFSSVDDLRQKMLAMSNDAGSDAALENFTLERSGSGWIFRGTSTDPQSGLGEGAPPIPLDQLEALLKIQFRVTLPGKAGQTNAHEVVASGGKTTFIWKPRITDARIQMEAHTSGGGGSSLPLMPIAAGVGAVLLVALVLVMRRPSTPSPLGPTGVLPPSEVAAVVGAPQAPDAPQPGSEDATH